MTGPYTIALTCSLTRFPNHDSDYNRNRYPDSDRNRNRILNLDQVRMTGCLSIPETGTYTIALTSDDGSRLLLDNKTVIDHGNRYPIPNAKPSTKPNRTL